jgi:Fic family protein
LLEEAISSSQIEGAMTTSKEAREMIHKGIKPQTTDQHMIVNNFEAMNYIKNELSKKELELSDMLYLQDLLTKNTLEEPADG